MGRAGAKRSKQANDESPTNNSASKKRRTDKKKIAPKKVEREQKIDPSLKAFSDKFKQPEDAIQFLVQNSKMSVADFIKNHWGTKPLAMHSDGESKDLEKIFTFDYLEEIIEQSANSETELIPEKDVVFSKVVENKRKEGDVDEITKEGVKKLYDDDFAVQFNQPQRFQDCLWAFVEKLECYFGSLVTCKAFIVPAGTQSHPLRYDDTERFILQLSGSTSWKLFTIKGAQYNDFNDDIRPEEVGDECLSATLKAGDVLYMPKRTIFESKGETDGVYLDFGTFEGLDYANLLTQTITGLIEEECATSEELRKPLPPGYILRPSSVSNVKYAEVLTKLAESIKCREEPIPTAEALIQQFMSSRLPPHGVPKFEPDQSEEISKNSEISLKDKEHITWYVRSSENAEMDEDDADDDSNGTRDLTTPNELVILSSLNNERSQHMMVDAQMRDTESDAFSIGIEYKEIMEKLEKAEKPIKVEDLTEGIEKADTINPLILAKALNNIGAITVNK